MTSSDYEDVILEFLDIFIHTVLYVRKIYPEAIFRRRRIYNIPVFVSIFPPVNDYIRQVLQSARYLLKEEKLFRLELSIYRDVNDDGEYREQQMENYCCAISKLTKQSRDSYLFHFEDNVKKALLLLEERVKPLPRLSKRCRFKLMLETTQSAYYGMMNQNALCDFLWFREDTEDVIDATNEEKIQILPVTNINQIGLEVHVEWNER